VCRGAQLFFNLETEEREREVSRLLTWLLCSKANSNGNKSQTYRVTNNTIDTYFI